MLMNINRKIKSISARWDGVGLCPPHVKAGKMAVFGSKFWRYASLLMILSGILPVQSTPAQETEPPKYEMRGAWIATDYGQDWPLHTFGESAQKGWMIQLLDYLQDAGINAVFFEVRSFGDAMYQSSHEPWSQLLLDAQGNPPTYDPLLFAVEETHRRGMELHAWINPYRVHDRGTPHTANHHVTVTHPEWTYEAGDYIYLDPGIRDVRNYTSRIVMDIARRYDVDGIHLYDHFYPYPDAPLTLDHRPDMETFAQENRGFTDILDWRRDNINLQISQIADSLRTFNADLKFGVSPYGIWKNGVPDEIVGLDAYNVLYADATAWIEQKTIDYLVPKLYWAFGGDQDYAKLAEWWQDQSEDRHLYIGHALDKVGPLFSATEVPDQAAFNRNHPDILGSVFFRASQLHPLLANRFAQRMRDGLYKYPALPPPMDWKDKTAPPAPLNLAVQKDGDSIQLTWDVSGDTPGRYTVYRVNSDSRPDASLAAQDPGNLIALIGEPRFRDTPNLDRSQQWYFVQSVSANSIESGPSNIVASPVAVTREVAPIPDPMSITAYPTIFDEQIRIDYSLQEGSPVTLQVFDTIGRRVTTLIEDKFRPSGQHTFLLSSSEHVLPSGIYWIVLSANQQRVTQTVIRAR